METYRFDKYVTTLDTLQATLDEFGVAILPSVLNETECEQMLTGMWYFLEHISQRWPKPIRRGEPRSWAGIFELSPLHSMLIQHWGAGHTQASWDVRQNEKIVDIFAQLWSCDREDLLVSFDGLSMGLPPEVTGRGFADTTKPPVLHCDQSFCRNNFECVQSWVTANDVAEGDATLCVLEGSHRHHEAFATTFGVLRPTDWFQLSDPAHYAFYASRGCEVSRIMCPRGSVVLWDSRTIHCGVEAIRGRASRLERAVIYVCCMPRYLCDRANLEKKRQALRELRTTSHYPCQIKLFPETPRRKSIPSSITPIDSPVLTALGRSLAGL